MLIHFRVSKAFAEALNEAIIAEIPFVLNSMAAIKPKDKRLNLLFVIISTMVDCIA